MAALLRAATIKPHEGSPKCTGTDLGPNATSTAASRRSGCFNDEHCRCSFAAGGKAIFVGCDYLALR